MARQLGFRFILNEEATFEQFFSDSYREIVCQLKEVAQNPFQKRFYLWGTESVGKTHLLQAACHEMAKVNLPAAYIPLKDYHSLSPDILQGMEQLALVCCDDVNAIADQKDWQEALFHLYNRVLETNTALIVSANTSPNQLTIPLKDLTSRLQQMICYQLKPLQDDERRMVLQFRALQCALQLSTEVANYILDRWPRRMDQLITLLDELDKASMESQRHLTIPFVKEVMSRI